MWKRDVFLKRVVQSFGAIGTILCLVALWFLVFEKRSLAGTRPCIMDVGFNVGQDSAAYIEAGYDVIAIEANPYLVKEALQRTFFARAVKEGRLQLLNAAIVSKNDAEQSWVTFYVGGHTERNSMFKCRYAPCQEIKVATVTCAHLLNYCQPTYVKVDVEGADALCLESLFDHIIDDSGKAPKYISSEDFPTSLFDKASSAGYVHFKHSPQKLHHGGMKHGAGSGPFGEFVLDPVSKFSWQYVGNFQKQKRVGDVHMKHNSSWFDLTSNEILQVYNQSALVRNRIKTTLV